MNVRCQEISQGSVDQLMPLNPGAPGELFGNDVYVEMATPVRRPGVSSVEVALVLDADLTWPKPVDQQ